MDLSSVSKALFGNHATELHIDCVTSQKPVPVSELYGKIENGILVDDRYAMMLEAWFMEKLRSHGIYPMYKTDNPEYMALYDRYLSDSSDTRYIDYDSKYGDFFLNGYRVDLKRSYQQPVYVDMKDDVKNMMPLYVAGAITMVSLKNFARGDGRSVYLCVSYDFSRMFLADADGLLQYTNEFPSLIKTAKGKGVEKSPEEITDKDRFIRLNDFPRNLYHEIF